MTMSFTDFAYQAQDWGSTPMPMGVNTVTPSFGISDYLTAAVNPFKNAFQSLTGPKAVEAAAGGLVNTLLQRSGLVSTPKNEGSQTVVYYDKPNAGVTPPASLNVVMPTTQSKESGGFFQSEGTKTVFKEILVVVGVIVVALILMSKGKW